MSPFPLVIENIALRLGICGQPGQESFCDVPVDPIIHIDDVNSGVHCTNLRRNPELLDGPVRKVHEGGEKVRADRMLSR